MKKKVVVKKKKKPVVGKSKLFVSHNLVSCPLCRLQCECVSADGKRFVVRHPDGYKPCENHGKMWTIPQLSMMAEEV